MVSYYLPTGSKIGVGHQVDLLARAMIKRGHTVDIVSASEPSCETPYRTIQIQLAGPLRTFRFATALRKVDFSSYDIVHAHGDDYWLWKRRAAAHIRTLHGSNLSEAMHIRGLKERSRMALLGLSEVLASVVADAAVVVSPGTRRWMPWVRTVIPNGVDLECFHPDAALRSNNPLVLFVGTWGGRKRGRSLADAFSKDVRSQLPNAELWMVTRDAPTVLPEGIRALGRVSDAELQMLYRRAWLFCLPSSYEGFGIPYVEAMASGTAVVATPNVGSNYLLDGQPGAITPLENLGPKILELLTDPKRRSTLQTTGTLRAASFSIESVINQYEKLYFKLLQGPNRRVRRSSKGWGTQLP